MKSNKKYFGLVFIIWICVLFLMGLIISTEINTKPNKYSEQLQNAVSYTDLPFYTWGGSGSECAFDIVIDSSNNTYIVGSTSSFGSGGYDICLLKYNSSKGMEWDRIYGGPYWDKGTSMIMDYFDNIYIAGYTESYGAGGSDLWVLKINTTGEVEWNHTWGGIDNEFGWDIALDSQNNAYVVGRTNSFGSGGYDMCLVKFNSSGVVWNYTCGGAANEAAYGLTLDPQGNVYVVGDTQSFGVGKSDLYLVKFNSSGVVWYKTWGCVESDHGTTIIYSPSGDLYVAGYYEQPPNCTESGYAGPFPKYIGLIKFTSDGSYQWNNTCIDFNYAYTSAMVMDSSGNAYIAGHTPLSSANDYDLCLVRFNSSGEADWSCIWGGSYRERSQGLVLGPNRTALVVGYTESYGAGSAGSSDLCMVEFKIGQCPLIQPKNHVFIPGYDVITLIGIAVVDSILFIKTKLLLKKKKK